MSVFEGMDLTGARAPEVVDDNTEAKIRIIDVKVDRDKNGLDYILPRFEIDGNDFAKDFTKFLHVPNSNNRSEMDAKKFEKARWNMTEFMACFSINPERPGDPEDWAGMEGWAILGKSKDDGEFGEQNYVRKFVAPR